MKEINEISAINEVIANNERVILDFSAPWCVPCKKIGAMLEEIENSNQNITIVKVNTEIAVDAVDVFDIRNVPTLLYYKNNEMKCRTAGVSTLAMIQEKIDNYLL